MGFFSNLIDSVKRKQAEIRDRREFLDMVEEKARPIRRKAYMMQTLKEVVKEGVEKAKQDSAKKVPQKKKTEADFGMQVTRGLEDPYKFLDPPKKTKTPKKTKSRKKKK
tara:strand:- start:853 stop:1179 length:327 start_codon:yes stop_codon:yes gene_type:complete